MHARKLRMAELADAFLVLPGGLGTLEEMFETLTWCQLGLHRKPLCLVNTGGYYDSLVAFLDGGVREGFLRPSSRALCLVATDVDAALALLERTVAHGGVATDGLWRPAHQVDEERADPNALTPEQT
jgi:uncharacterized protein (TIGR00730 family)